MKRVLVFGVFDGLHDGHIFFLNQAKILGDHLTVAVAPTQIVARLKGHAPQFSLDERISALLGLEFVNEVIAGDGELNTWRVVFTLQPDVIALGYDQKEQLKSLKGVLSATAVSDWKPSVVVLKPHKSKNLHSSILKKKAVGKPKTVSSKKKKNIARPVFSARKSVAQPTTKVKRIKKA